MKAFLPFLLLLLLFNTIKLSRFDSSIQSLVFRLVFSDQQDKFKSFLLQKTPLQGSFELVYDNQQKGVQGQMCQISLDNVKHQQNKCLSLSTQLQRYVYLLFIFVTEFVPQSTQQQYLTKILKYAINFKAAGILFTSPKKLQFQPNQQQILLASQISFILRIPNNDSAAQIRQKQEGSLAKVGVYPYVNCQAVLPRHILYICMGVWWLGLFLWWLINTYSCYKLHSSNLQHLLTALPTIKIIDTVLVNYYISYCPELPNEFAGLLLQLARVGLLIIMQATLVCILIMLSRGWMLINQNFSMCMSIFLSLFMCIEYMSFISYMIADYNTMFGLVSRVIFTIIQVSIFIFTMFCSISVICKLKVIIEWFRFQKALDDEEQSLIIGSVILKKNMQIRYTIFLSIFFINQIVIHGFFPYYQFSLPNFTFSDVFYQITSLAQQVILLITLTGLLINYRSRNFPAFFTLVSEQQGMLANFARYGSIHDQNSDRQDSIPLSRASLVVLQDDVSDQLLSDIDQNECALIIFPHRQRQQLFGEFDQQLDQRSVPTSKMAIGYRVSSKSQFHERSSQSHHQSQDQEIEYDSKGKKNQSNRCSIISDSNNRFESAFQEQDNESDFRINN